LGPQILKDASQVIDDESIGIPEHPGLHTGEFPPGQVAVEPIEERPVVADAGRERAEEVGCPERDLDIQVEVALEHHGGMSSDRFLAARVSPGLHVVLEDLQGLRVADPIEAGDLVKSDYVPLADKPWFRLPGRVAAKQIWHRGFTTGDQDRIGGKFSIAVRLSGAAWSELDQVIVVLDKRHEAHQDEILLTLVEGVAAKPHRPKQRIDPFAGREPGTCLADLFEAAGRYLDRLQLLDREGVDCSADDVLGHVRDFDLAPDTRGQEATILLLWILLGDRCVRDTKLD